MENIVNQEVIDKLDICQSRFVKVDKFGWWDLELIQTDAGMLFYYKKSQESISIRGVRHKLSAPDHKEISGLFEVTWRTLRCTAH